MASVDRICTHILGHDDRRPAPLILGHEAAGDVIEGPLKGTRVTINPLVHVKNVKNVNQIGLTFVVKDK